MQHSGRISKCVSRHQSKCYNQMGPRHYHYDASVDLSYTWLNSSAELNTDSSIYGLGRFRWFSPWRPGILPWHTTKLLHFLCMYSECMASRCCCEHLRTHECVKRTQRVQQKLRGTRMRHVEVGKAVCPRWCTSLCDQSLPDADFSLPFWSLLVFSDARK